MHGSRLAGSRLVLWDCWREILRGEVTCVAQWEIHLKPALTTSVSLRNVEVRHLVVSCSSWIVASVCGQVCGEVWQRAGVPWLVPSRRTAGGGVVQGAGCDACLRGAVIDFGTTAVPNEGAGGTAKGEW